MEKFVYYGYKYRGIHSGVFPSEMSFGHNTRPDIQKMQEIMTGRLSQPGKLPGQYKVYKITVEEVPFSSGVVIGEPVT